MKKIKQFSSLKLLQPSIDNILLAAESLLIQKGFNKIDFADLQQESGLSRAIIYSAFRNKYEIFIALAKKYFAEINQKLASFYLSEEFSSHLLIENLVYFFKSHSQLLDLLSINENTFEENITNIVFSEYFIERDKFFSLIEKSIAKITKSDSLDKFQGFGLLLLSNVIGTYRATHFSFEQFSKYKAINPDFSVLNYDSMLQIVITDLLNIFLKDSNKNNIK